PLDHDSASFRNDKGRKSLRGGETGGGAPGGHGPGLRKLVRIGKRGLLSTAFRYPEYSEDLLFRNYEDAPGKRVGMSPAGRARRLRQSRQDRHNLRRRTFGLALPPRPGMIGRRWATLSRKEGPCAQGGESAGARWSCSAW